MKCVKSVGGRTSQTRLQSNIPLADPYEYSYSFISLQAWPSLSTARSKFHGASVGTEPNGCGPEGKFTGCKSDDAYPSISRCTTSRNSPNGQLKRLREPSGAEFRQISGLVRQILGLLVRLVSKATRLRLKCTVPSHALKVLRAPHKSLANVSNRHSSENVGAAATTS